MNEYFKVGDLVKTCEGDLALITDLMKPDSLDPYGWLLFLPNESRGIPNQEFSFVRISNMNLSLESRPEIK